MHQLKTRKMGLFAVALSTLAALAGCGGGGSGVGGGGGNGTLVAGVANAPLTLGSQSGTLSISSSINSSSGTKDNASGTLVVAGAGTSALRVGTTSSKASTTVALPAGTYTFSGTSEAADRSFDAKGTFSGATSTGTFEITGNFPTQTVAGSYTLAGTVNNSPFNFSGALPVSSVVLPPSNGLFPGTYQITYNFTSPAETTTITVPIDRTGAGSGSAPSKTYGQINVSLFFDVTGRVGISDSTANGDYGGGTFCHLNSSGAATVPQVDDFGKQIGTISIAKTG